MRWTLTKKVLLGTSIWLLVVALFGGLTIYGLRTNIALSNYLTEDALKHASLNQQFGVDLSRAATKAQTYLRTHAAEDRQQMVAALTKAHTGTVQISQLYQQRNTTSDMLNMPHATLHQQRQATLHRADLLVLATLDAAQRQDAATTTQVLQQLQQFEDDFVGFMVAANDVVNDAVVTSTSEIQRLDRVRMTMAYTTYGVFALMALVIVQRIRHSIVKPINALAAVANTVAHGDLSPTVSVTTNDEIGSLQHAFNHMVQSLRDQATAQHQAEAELKHLALYDQLTHLPNRALFNDRLQHALMSMQRHGEYVAVLFLDLDNFKVVNDGLGHTSGDRLLTVVAERLHAAVRPNDTVARFGGDEFIILLEHVGSAHDAIAVAQRVLHHVQAPVLLGGHEVRPQASIGIALSTPEACGADDLLRDADTALGRAKQNGKAHYQIFDASMNAQAMERLQLEAELRHGLERGEFVLYYQPIVTLHGGKIVGTEALVRWRHPQRGMVPPNVFIPLAEETGLILGLGEWVLRTACQQLRYWQTHCAYAPQFVSVNISARQFADPALTAMVAQALCDHDLPGAALELELTESIVMENGAATHDVLHALKQLGVHLAIDDFGTGYSSLSYLKRLPVDVLKVDKSFVDGLGSDTEDTAIVRAIVSLAHTLNLEVTGEGIETAAQCHDLQTLGCNHGQGYYFAKPQPADAITTLLAAAPAYHDDPVAVA